MNEPVMSWAGIVAESEARNLLAKKLYVVMSEPTGGKGLVLQNLADHLAYQNKLEEEGIMFGAGPLADDAERQWPGGGLFIYRAESRAEARKLAEADPMHAGGARSFTVRAWLLNEGTFSVRLYYSGGKPHIA
jgi:uncharacterized protein